MSLFVYTRVDFDTCQRSGRNFGQDLFVIKAVWQRKAVALRNSGVVLLSEQIVIKLRTKYLGLEKIGRISGAVVESGWSLSEISLYLGILDPNQPRSVMGRCDGY